MQVKMHTEKTFELTLTDSESANVRKLASVAKVDSAKLLEHLVDSSIQAASDQLSESQEPPWGD